MEQNNQSSWWVDLLALTLFISLLFGTILGSRPLGVPDEARYSEIPREMLLNDNYITPRLNAVKYFEKPILVYWLQTASLKSFGLNEWAARLPTALLALVACIATYAASRKLYQRTTGLFASVILATSLLYFAMAHIITLDMTVSVMLTVALLCFALAMQEAPGRHRRWFMWGLYAFAALATLAKGLIGIIFPGMIIFCWLLIFNNWRELKTFYLPSGIIVFLLIAAPWHIAAQLANPEFFNFYFIDQQFIRYFTKEAGRYKADWFFLPILILGFFPWTAFLLQTIKFNLPTSWQQRHQEKSTVFFMLWASLIFLFFSFSHSKLIPYILPIMPPLAILTARYLTAAWNNPNLKGLKLGAILLVVLSLLFAAGLLKIPQYTTVPNPQAGQNYLYTMAFLLIVGSIITAICLWQHRFKAAITVLVFSTSIFLITLIAAIPNLDGRSIKSFTNLLNPILKPTDEILSYNTYYQDLPFYLQRRITVVNWQNELEYGMRYENTSEWMINDAIFEQRWKSKRRMFLITSQNTYQNLRKRTHLSFYLLAETNGDVLVSNQPVQLPISQ